MDANNIGASKGRGYDRVLVFATKPMLAYLKTGDVSKAGDRSKLYVAATRARHSVAFVVPDDFQGSPLAPEWVPARLKSANPVSVAP